MNARNLVQIMAMVAIASLIATPSSARGRNQGQDFNEDGDFSWTVISPDGQAMASQLYRDRIDEWKDRFGEEFLIIRDGEHKYVIADKELFQRAKRASGEIRKHSSEIGAYANAQARLSMAEMRTDERQAELKERRRQIEREIQDRERRGRSTDALDQKLLAVTSELQALRSMQTQNRLSPDEKRALRRRSDEASERVQRVVDRINQEMRSIYETAKSRNLAHPVE